MEFLLPRESYNLAMLFMCFILLWWMYEAVLRFLRALKFHAARMAGMLTKPLTLLQFTHCRIVLKSMYISGADNIVYVPGLGQYAAIFDFVFQDHYLSLRQWRGPVQPDRIDCACVPFDICLVDDPASHTITSSSGRDGGGSSSTSTAATAIGVDNSGIEGDRVCQCVRVKCSSKCVAYVVRGLHVAKLDALLRKHVNIHHKVRICAVHSHMYVYAYRTCWNLYL
jgi:hypothetical protein